MDKNGKISKNTDKGFILTDMHPINTDKPLKNTDNIPIFTDKIN